jgi:serine/threonine protein phosphatase PrpC
MEESYEAYGYSVAKVGKEKNGDHFLLEQLSEEGLLIAIVADGVSSQPCDWLASETICQKVVEFFKSNIAEKDILKRLRSSIIQANEFVSNTQGACLTMCSTLSVVVWEVARDMLFLANIGDSRIYSSFGGKLELLTKDDSTLVRGPILEHGLVRIIDKPVLTQVIGQGNLRLSVAVQLFKEAEIIILATDGFYEARRGIFTKTLSELSQQPNFKASFEVIVQSFEILRGDDLTVLMIRRRKAAT